MTNQELFNIACEGLAGQGFRPAVDSTTRVCRYRAVGEDGKILKCAIGHAIPDNKYTVDLEGCMPDGRTLIDLLGLKDRGDFASRLRKVHDWCQTARVLMDYQGVKSYQQYNIPMKDALKLFAQEEGLEVPACLG